MISSAPKSLPVAEQVDASPTWRAWQYVVKDQATDEFVHLRTQEHFLLMRLDGRASIEDICVELGLGQIKGCSFSDAPQIRQVNPHEFTCLSLAPWYEG